MLTQLCVMLRTNLGWKKNANRNHEVTEKVTG